MTSPWVSEPSLLVFISKVELPCVVARNGSGALCGYVGVRRQVGDYEGEVHGGITYNAPTLPSHIPADIVAGFSPVSWVGFDCAHSGDYMPFIGVSGCGCVTEYKTLQYVIEECERLAYQLK